MTVKPNLRPCWAVLTAAVLLTPQPTSAHFLWITVDPPEETSRECATVRLFFSEPPVPEGPGFLKVVRDVKLTVDGQPLPLTQGEETLDARWAGKLPTMVDAIRDFGLMTRGGQSYRLFYTARAQTAPLAVDEKAGEIQASAIATPRGDGASPAVKPGEDKLRVRLVSRGGRSLVQVLFDGKPVSKARIKIYPDDGDTEELAADEQGFAAIPGVAEGKTALWANWVDGKAGEIDGKPFSETRYYASFTYRPMAGADESIGPATAAQDAKGAEAESRTASESPKDAGIRERVKLPTEFALMPEPAVNSFGGAVLGDWLYVYSGHVGRTHRYSVETTSKHFRRLSLKDRTTWEDLPMARDVQGAALVSDGRFVYRLGGMAARNQPDRPHDLHSVADFARFDPDSRTWTDLPPMPQPRSTFDAVVIGRTVYVVGGWSMKGESEESEFCEDAAAFELDKPEAGWRTIEQPFRRRALSAAEAGGKLYVLGGLSDEGKVGRRVDVYDPATNSWTLGPDLPGTSRVDGFGTSAFGVEGRLYYSGAAGRIFRLDATGTAWEAIGAWSLPRITHRLLPGPDQCLLAVGGNAKGKQTPVIEAVTLPSSKSREAAGGD